jgi:dTDP-4-dehydrorhamnose 3,5-epimerase
MGARLKVIDTPIHGLKTVQRNPIRDARGYFSRFFCAEEFRLAGLNPHIAQINQSYSKAIGTVRGMHFQAPPHAESKFVSCIRGEIFDVAVDLRRNSPTFLHWHGVILSAENQRSLFIPEGFAHGFQTLTDDSELLYLVGASYEPSAEGGVNAQDPLIDIVWPRSITEMSDKDRNAPFLPADYAGIDLTVAT